MTLPYDIARCPGRVAGVIRKKVDPECLLCERRLSGIADDPQAYRLVWMAPPPATPCPDRIEAREAA